MVSKELLAQQISDCVEDLRKNDCGCCTIKLEGVLAVCVGWRGGYHTDRWSVIHSKSDPTYAIVAGIKVWTSDSLPTDYDFISYPWIRDSLVIDVDVSVNPKENYVELAETLLNAAEKLLEYDIAEDGEILIKSTED